MDPDISALIETFKRTVFAKEVAGFLALFDRDVVIFDLWKKWAHRGIDAWRQTVAEWFDQTGENRDAVSLDDVVISGDGGFRAVTAFVTFSCTSPTGAVLRAMSERLTWILAKKAGAWKIVHQHTSAPVGDDLKIRFDRD